VRTTILLGAAVLLGSIAAELMMDPDGGTRFEIISIFFVSATLVAAGSWWLPRLARHVTRLRHELVVLSLAALGTVALILGVGASLMFISAHDLRVVWVVLGFGLVVAAVFTMRAVAPLTTDLERIARSARSAHGGDLAARTQVDRRDEIGAVADALDGLTARLEGLEDERLRSREARQAFLTAIGHDLRTPLAALQAAVEALQDGIAADPERYLVSMQRDIEALAGLVDDLFLLARIESGQLVVRPIALDLTELADEAIEALRPTARRRGVELTLDAKGRVPVTGGPEALGRVIRNLVDNAIEHSPRHGIVRVCVERDDAALVRVLDDGPGFEAGFVDQAFESFTRGDRSRARSTGGAGLGLAIAHGFIMAHGGSIWAEPGPGGRVGFRLPHGSVISGR
jgi:signal transduction histidine kinase